jgi:hypothetical protein
MHREQDASFSGFSLSAIPFRSTNYLGFLNNRLQLPSVADRILDHRPTRYQNLFLRPLTLTLLREVYPRVIPHDPAA